MLLEKDHQDSTFPAMSINSLRKSLSALKTWHNSLTFSVPDLKSKYLAAIPLFFAELVTETYGMLLSWRTNLMCPGTDSALYPPFFSSRLPCCSVLSYFSLVFLFLVQQISLLCSFIFFTGICHATQQL